MAATPHFQVCGNMAAVTWITVSILGDGDTRSRSRCFKNSTWRKRFFASSSVLSGPPRFATPSKREAPDDVPQFFRLNVEVGNLATAESFYSTLLGVHIEHL